MGALLASIPSPDPTTTPVPGPLPTPDPGVAAWWLVGGFVVGFFVLREVFPRLLPGPLPAGVGREGRTTLIGWELERLGGLAKGLASTAGGFLVALVVGLFKRELVGLDVVSLIGCIAGSVGMLLLAAALSSRSMAFARAELSALPPPEEPEP
jgi:hypothetical protein